MTTTTTTANSALGVQPQLTPKQAQPHEPQTPSPSSAFVERPKPQLSFHVDAAKLPATQLLGIDSFYSSAHARVPSGSASATAARPVEAQPVSSTIAIVTDAATQQKHTGLVQSPPRRERVDVGARGGLERDHRDEFVATEPRLGRIGRQDGGDPLGRDLQHAVARGVAVDVVDRLEMVEVEQEQGNVALFGHGAGDELLPRNDQRAAVLKAAQINLIVQPTLEEFLNGNSDAETMMKKMNAQVNNQLKYR